VTTEGHEAGGGAERSTILRAVNVLDAFGDGDDVLSLSELARVTGLPKPTTLRLARRLVETGMLERAEAGYRLGLRLFELGQRVTTPRRLRQLAAPALERLYANSRQLVHLGVRDGRDVVLVESIGHDAGAEFDTNPGARVPMHSTALGKAILAYSSPSVLRDALSAPLEPMTTATIRDSRSLATELVRVRREGVAHGREESMRGLRCIGCPVLGPDGTAVGAISVSVLRRRRWDPARLAADVRAAAAAVTHAAGLPAV
jgi:IclR family transcriptional regulator, acetate operon repressor